MTFQLEDARFTRCFALKIVPCDVYNYKGRFITARLRRHLLVT